MGNTPSYVQLIGGLEPWMFMTFHSIGNFIIPTDELHHFSEGLKPLTRQDGAPKRDVCLYTPWILVHYIYHKPYLLIRQISYLGGPSYVSPLDYMELWIMDYKLRIRFVGPAHPIGNRAVQTKPAMKKNEAWNHQREYLDGYMFFIRYRMIVGYLTLFCVHSVLMVHDFTAIIPSTIPPNFSNEWYTGWYNGWITCVYHIIPPFVKYSPLNSITFH